MQSVTKSRIRRALWVIVPALLVGALALPRALAWGHPHPHASSPAELAEHLEDGLDHLLDRVDATDEQRAQASAIAERRAPELFAIITEGKLVRQQLKQALLAEQLDAAKLAAARTRLNELATKASAVGLDSVFELSQVLTPAQRKQVADKLSRFDH
jgi:Spy/CpxP family protein refolding chaperone